MKNAGYTREETAEWLELNKSAIKQRDGNRYGLHGA
jgi:hypothetical protein